MINFFNEIKWFFKKEEISTLKLILLLLLGTIFLDSLSFTAIIPVANTILFEKPFNIPFLNLNYTLDLNYKFIVLFIFVIIFILKNLIIIFFNVYFTEFFKKINNRVSSVVFDYFLNQEYKFFISLSSKDFFQKTLKDLNLTNIFFISFVNLLSEIIFFFAISGILIYINFKIFLFVFVGFTSFVALYFYIFKKRIKYWSYLTRNSSSNLHNLVLEGFVGFKDIIIYDLKEKFNLEFDQNVNKLNHATKRITFLNNIQKYWLEIVGIIIMVSALAYLVFFEVKIIELIPILGLFLIVVFRVLSSLNRIIINFQNVKFYYPSFKAIANECKKSSTIKKNELNKNFKFENCIEFSDVSFGYSESKNILNKVNLKIFKNQCIGIFGTNGSGKSTFSNLVAGLLKPSKGQIIIDNSYDLYENRNTWFKHISYVQQEVFLMDDSIENNITLQNKFSKNTYQLAEVNRILSLEQYFSNFSDGLSTQVGRNGMNLSGGQKQIISIARALYKNSNTLIFDEPTSAMDSVNSELIKQLILKLKNKKTIILITHDKLLFSNCFDLIFDVNEKSINKK
jgi:ATP-binding cassette, subfamily B, bacterial PglK